MLKSEINPGLRITGEEYARAQLFVPFFFPDLPVVGDSLQHGERGLV